MADITNPEVIDFSNSEIRRAADRLAVAYYHAIQMRDIWIARGYGASVPNDASPVVDGAATDGRPAITGVDIHNMINRLGELIADYEANSNAKLNTILRVSPSPDRGLV